jgi:hypothetical protein
VGRYRSSIALAGIGLLISILLIARGPDMGEKGAATLRAAAADLDMKQRELAAAVEARATTLAQLPRLAWAVATDEATVRDLTPDELGFRVQAGELIEVAQIQKKTAHITPLLRIPATPSLQAPMTELGPCLLMPGDQILVAAIVAIEPRERADVVRGALAVARPLDVESIVSQLTRAGIAARLVVPTGSLSLTEIPALARRPEVTVRVGATSALRLVARLPAPKTGVWVLIGLLVLLVFGAAAAVSARRAGRAIESPVLAGPGSALPARLNLSRLMNLPSDTTPVLDLVVAERNISASSNGHSLRNGAATPIVEIVSGPVAGGVAHTDAIPASTADFKSLFREFIDLRKRCGDPSQAPTYDEFVHSLGQRRTEMLQAHSASEVFFQIVFIDGRAVVRAKGLP